MLVPLIIIRALLKGKHIDVKERAQKGAPVTAILKYGDILRVLKDMINESRIFPFDFNDSEYTNYEGIVIERKDEKFLCHSQRMHPTNPGEIVEKITKEFDNIDEAANYYLKWALNLPGDLDGYKVIE